MSNPNYEILEQILRLDVEAAAATLDWRNAQKELSELAKKTRENEELIAKTKTEMAFVEGELRRQYKKLDDLEERKNDRSAKLFAAKTDDDHRALKRDVDNIEKEIRDVAKRAEESEARIETFKSVLSTAETELTASITATADERKKAEEAEQKSGARVSEINGVRETHLMRLDDRLSQHYLRVARLTRNPNGPITRIVNNACGNCHMTLSPQLTNRIARGQDIEFCPSCTHILLTSK